MKEPKKIEVYMRAHDDLPEDIFERIAENVRRTYIAINRWNVAIAGADAAFARLAPMLEPLRDLARAKPLARSLRNQPPRAPPH